MVSQKAGGAMLGSTIIVMAWTGVYFSRPPRSNEGHESPSNNNTSSAVYEIINGSDYFSITLSGDFDRRDKIKEVKLLKIFKFLLTFSNHFRRRCVHHSME